jgi:hypothetical protein
VSIAAVGSYDFDGNKITVAMMPDANFKTWQERTFTARSGRLTDIYSFLQNQGVIYKNNI